MRNTFVIRSLFAGVDLMTPRYLHTAGYLIDRHKMHHVESGGGNDESGVVLLDKLVLAWPRRRAFCGGTIHSSGPGSEQHDSRMRNTETECGKNLHTAGECACALHK